jgi:hypothetical protein
LRLSENVDTLALVTAGTVRASRLRWSLFWAVVSYFVTTLGSILTSYLTSVVVSPLVRALVSTGVGLAVVLTGVLIDWAKTDSGPQGSPAAQQPAPTPGYPTPYPGYPPNPGYPPGSGYPPATTRRPARRYSLATVLVLVLVLCGGGGLGVTYVVNWVSDKVVAFVSPAKGGVERLAHPASVTNDLLLTVEVTSVTVNSGFTVVHLRAKNSSKDAAFLPVFGYTQLAIPAHTTLTGDPMRSDWAETVPGNGEITGYIVFNGSVPDGPVKVTLSFTWPGGPSLPIDLM